MKARVIACSTDKGGVLKSSVTTHLAGVFASEGKKVLIIDMDSQGNSSLSFGMNPDRFENTIYDVMLSNLPAEKAIVKAHNNIDLLPSNDDMRFFENDIKDSGQDDGVKKFMFLKNAVGHLRFHYDIILVDSPPTLSTIQGNILAFVDEVIIPFQPEPFSQRSLIKAVGAIMEMKAELNPNLNILGILATLVDARANIHSEIIQECRQLCQEYDWYMFEEVIPRSIRFASELKQKGLPATISNPNHYIVKRYYELGKEIEKQWQEKKEQV